MNSTIKQVKFLVRFRVNYLCILFLVISHGIAYSQSVEFEPITYNFTTENGLPSLETYSVNQDSKGFIWICTDAGVSRFDGFKFKTFTTDDGLTDNVVFDTYEDYRGRIWFLTYNSLLCYYENGHIHDYKYNNKIAEFVHEQIPSKFLAIDSLDNVYYSLKYLGLFKIDNRGKYQQLHNGSFGYITKQIDDRLLLSLRILERKNLYTWFGKLTFNSKKPVRSNQSTIYTYNFYLPETKYNLKNNYACFNDLIYNIEQNKIIFEGDDIVTFKVVDSVFWICSLRGLIKAELGKDGMLIQKDIYFKNIQVSNITKIDKCFMISTIENGVFVCRNFDFLNAKSVNGLLEGAILSISKLNNEILVSTSLKGQNIATMAVTDFGIENRSSKKLVTVNDELFLFSSHLFTNQKFSQSLNTTVNYLGYTSDFKVFKNELYGSCDGVYKLNLKTKEFTMLYDGWQQGKGVRQRFLSAITILPNGKIIVGSNQGLFQVINKELYRFDIGVENLKVISLNYNEKYGLIIGTSDRGVITSKNGSVSNYDFDFGLLTNKINTLIIDENSIFVGTTKGLNILTFKNGKMENLSYSSSDFHSSLDINSIFFDEEWLYLGTSAGLVKLKKRALIQNKVNVKKSKVILKDIQIDGEKISNSKKINFPYSANLLQLNFAVFQFSNWTGKKFQYRLNSSGQWIDIESPSINLYRPSGSFDVQIRYFRTNLKWSSPQTICHVDVLLPIWKRWYFWLLITLVLFVLFFFTYQKSQKRIHEKLIHETQMLSLEQQMQNARMNPHFVFNVLNSIHSYVLNNEMEKADMYLKKFSKLMREILISTKEGVVQVGEELSVLNKYLELEQLRHQYSFEFSVIINEVNENASIPSMMIQPFVENAILYTDKKELESSVISVEFDTHNKSCIQISIINSGIPSEGNLEKMQELNTKNAIGITRKRLSNYNQLLQSSEFGIEIEIMNDASTKIVLKVPILKN